MQRFSRGIGGCLLGALACAVPAGGAFDVSSGRTRCRLSGGPIAVKHRAGNAGASSVANGDGAVRCLLQPGGAAQKIGRAALAEFRNGRVAARRAIPERYLAIAARQGVEGSVATQEVRQ